MTPATAVVTLICEQEQEGYEVWQGAKLLRQQLHNSAYDRQEVQELRKFLKQPLVGASVQKLREGLKSYSTTNDVEPLYLVLWRQEIGCLGQVSLKQ